ncbi:Y-family DNA polymerase [Bacillus cereus]
MARLYEIPQEKDILIVNPIMGTYIKCSNYITGLALQYVPIEDFHQYSIDEFLWILPIASIYLPGIQMNLHYSLNVKYEHTRIECTIGIAPNLLMSKVALDIEAKKNKDGVAYWTYEDIPTKLWSIRPLSKF